MGIIIEGGNFGDQDRKKAAEQVASNILKAREGQIIDKIKHVAGDGVSQLRMENSMLKEKLDFRLSEIAKLELKMGVVVNKAQQISESAELLKVLMQDIYHHTDATKAIRDMIGKYYQPEKPIDSSFADEAMEALLGYMREFDPMDLEMCDGCETGFFEHTIQYSADEIPFCQKCWNEMTKSNEDAEDKS